MRTLKILPVAFLTCLAFVSLRHARAEEAVSREASEEPIVRRGFTLGLSIGAGATFLSPKSGVNSKNDGGLGGINLSIGGFLNPDLALLLKVTGVNYGAFDSELSTGIAAVVGPAVEYWLSDHFNLVGGAGLGVLTMEPKLSATTLTEYGFGGMAGINYFPWALRHHGLGFFADVSPIATSNFFVLTYQAGFSWQYY
jgi:hypothetical protein